MFGPGSITAAKRGIATATGIQVVTKSQELQMPVCHAIITPGFVTSIVAKGIAKAFS
jgi:hypothetical protein